MSERKGRKLNKQEIAYLKKEFKEYSKDKSNAELYVELKPKTNEKKKI